ncbi:hydantoinase B/oxoprolinase family protein [Alloyangia pacifica]|uniref:N-methylhydantoinase B n=1 Tax=Alloyangia pacifica TaxID=311180 RepID=A0A1I6VHN7_9RHOB|nr:hydantoinase B/oxoprolinase family protein [Alloyangia pacifica]SDH98328.1 N-methylhydantoinase B [Alloyangia pacifica]SFT13141.1 N-methylhydantoinase B [Alloyangia pacifica]
MTITPITQSLVWNTLVSIAEEMGSTLRRTAFSEAVREADDFSTGVFDRHGRLLSQGNFTPGHLGSMPAVVETVSSMYPGESLKPGDAIVLNDSGLGSGHFPDFYMVTPAFVDGDFSGWVVNIAHHVDVGGAAPGSQKVIGVTEAYQEGLRILPIKLVREGAFDAELLRMITANVRIPAAVEGDLAAQRNANEVGVDRFAELLRSVGRETLDAAVDAILDASEKRMREAISEIPDGTYSFDDWLDGIGEGETGLIPVAVDVTVSGDGMVIDFSRSGDQVAAAINAYFNYTRAHGFFAVKVFTDPELPQNEGGLRAIEVRAREGCFFNPKFPAPSGGRAAIQIRIFELINGAMAQALPDRVMAAYSHWSNPILSGTDDDTGERFIYYDLIFGGYGARHGADGLEGTAPVINCANIPVEVHETHNPVIIHRLALQADTGGAGQYRGGCGIVKEVELLASKASLTLLGDRHVKPPHGLFGGEAGTLASSTLLRGGEEIALISKQMVDLQAGDILRLQLAGAGGFGPAGDRDPAAIENDIADGFVTELCAARDYA